MTAVNTDPDFSVEVVNDLYRYRQKSLPLARVLACFGLFGLHRFYLGRTLTGVLMLLSAGGGLAWWIWDLLRLRKMVSAYNEEEATRQSTGNPPQGLGFLPPKEQLVLNGPPSWASRRLGRGRVVGSLLLLMLIGYSLGVVSNAIGLFEPVIIVAVFMAVTLLAARWKQMADYPLLQGLSRWNHRLRLYYHTVDPGSLWLLAVRPFVGLLIAPWRPRARAEVRLYLQLGLAFSTLFGVLNLVEFGSESAWTALGLLMAEFVQTLVFTYIFVAPIGAILITQILLTERDAMVWKLSAVTLVCIALGMVTVA